MKCKSCGREIELGSTVTVNCANCLKIALAMRNAKVQSGWKPTRLAHWAMKRAAELDIECS